MPLDEYLFGKAVRFFNRKKEEKDKLTVVELDGQISRLTLLACAATGYKIEIYGAEEEGGYKDLNFFLPTKFNGCSTTDLNTKFYLFRVFYLATQFSLNHNWWNYEGGLDEARNEAVKHSDEVLKNLFQQYPMANDVYQLLIRDFDKQEMDVATQQKWLFGKWMTNSEQVRDEGKLNNVNLDFFNKPLDDKATIMKARAVEEIKSIEVDKKAQEDYVLTHNFEKVETAEEFDGTWRDFDGDDELRDHQDALDELNLKLTVRVDDPVHSVYQADFMENTSVSESEESETDGVCFSYPEWDQKKRRYKPDFCKVYVRRHLAGDSGYVNDTLSQFRSELLSLRKILSSVNNKYKQVKRQATGLEIDVDAATDFFTALEAGITPSEKIYNSSRKKEKDISMLLLLDISLSSDSYVDGYRVLDVEKQMTILLGELLTEHQIDFAVSGFYSKTRNNTQYVSIKDFDEDWRSARAKIGGITPAGYTRIGAALRHAGQHIASRDAKSKWVVLLSDGKPNDFDKYEGSYGVNDIKQALKEYAPMHVNSYAMAIEATARYYLPKMFGQNNYNIVSSPYDLIKSMVVLYEKIKYNR
jgi:nitric oxide reductase NorD protein